MDFNVNWGHIEKGQIFLQTQHKSYCNADILSYWGIWFKVPIMTRHGCQLKHPAQPFEILGSRKLACYKHLHNTSFILCNYFIAYKMWWKHFMFSGYNAIKTNKKITWKTTDLKSKKIKWNFILVKWSKELVDALYQSLMVKNAKQCRSDIILDHGSMVYTSL